MIRSVRKTLPIVALIILVGCSGFPFRPVSSSPTGSITAEITQNPPGTLPPGADETLAPATTATTGTGTQPGGNNGLKIWVPAEFDPKGNNDASELLKARFDAFVAENKGMNLEIRVKALEGTGGMLYLSRRL
jgi:hypothetical protein